MSLKLRKVDLHVHTPASHDFKNKAVTADQIVEQAQKVGLDAIAITDHNNVDFIDEVKAAAKKAKFTVFPGIEISCGASVRGSIHLIALFDPSRTKDDLQKLVGQFGIKGTGENAFSSKSVSDVIDIVREVGGLPTLAHANSTHGALKDITGNPRTDIVRNSNLCAVEATDGDFKKAAGRRLLDYLNGTDPTYKRKLAVYKSSDNRCPDANGHCLDSIGSHFTYFKMGELTLEGLRQCFEDPDSRIVQDYETEKIDSAHPRIETITIADGFLGGQRLVLNPGMNSIIGGTGTGKSLIVEFLRFVFNRKPHASLLKDHNEKLEKQLGINGEVVVTFRDASGEEYELSRIYDNPRKPYESPVRCKNKTTSDQFTGDTSSIFPLLIYSQNEILEITRDPSSQLSLLDNFRDFDTYQQNLRRITQGIESLDHDLYQALKGSANLTELRIQQGTLDEQIKKAERKLRGSRKKRAVDQYLKLSEQRKAIEDKIEEYDALIETIAETMKDLQESAPLKRRSPKQLADIIAANISDRYRAVIASLKKEEATTRKAKQDAEASLQSWEKEKDFSEVEKKYKAEIKQKKAHESVEAERKKLVEQKKEIDAEVEAAKKAKTRYRSVRRERAKLLNELKEAKDGHFDERSAQAQLITHRSGGRLLITVRQGDNHATYTRMLKKLKIGSHAETKEVEEITRLISPIDLVDMVLDRDVEKLADKASLTEQKAESIIDQLGAHGNLMEVLSLQYKAYPEDRVEIQYQKKDGKYHSLSELSMGQKADALIMIALGDGEMPVVIDQPEDALDVPSIWTDICSRLRVSKHGRQFLFTTHNSSISVSSDSDQYLILDADGSKGWLEQSGSIDQRKIKDEVVGHLEGGYDSYDLKRKKYGL